MCNLTLTALTSTAILHRLYPQSRNVEADLA